MGHRLLLHLSHKRNQSRKLSRELGKSECCVCARLSRYLCVRQCEHRAYGQTCKHTRVHRRFMLPLNLLDPSHILLLIKHLPCCVLGPPLTHISKSLGCKPNCSLAPVSVLVTAPRCVHRRTGRSASHRCRFHLTKAYLIETSTTAKARHMIRQRITNESPCRCLRPTCHPVAHRDRSMRFKPSPVSSTPHLTPPQQQPSVALCGSFVRL